LLWGSFQGQNLAMLRMGCEGHVTPEWEPHSNLAVAGGEPVESRAAKENPSDPVAVEKPPG
jgi:hypothetical protein